MPPHTCSRWSQTTRSALGDGYLNITLLKIDWCCFHYFVRNSLVALLEALCAQMFVNLRFRFLEIWDWRNDPSNVIDCTCQRLEEVWIIIGSSPGNGWPSTSLQGTRLRRTAPWKHNKEPWMIRWLLAKGCIHDRNRIQQPKLNTVTVTVTPVFPVDWCCFYYFARNSPVGLLEALRAQIWC